MRLGVGFCRHKTEMAGRAKQLAVSSEDSNHVSAPLVSYPKTPASIALIAKAFEEKGLFDFIAENDRASIYEHMVPTDFPAGEQLMTQGERGADYYVIESGEFDIYVHGPSEAAPGKCVVTRKPGESIGELGLMYGTERNATCITKSAVKCFVLTRDIYRSVILGEAVQKDQQITGFRPHPPGAATHP